MGWEVTNSLGVKKEKQFVFLGGAADRTCPLIAIGKRAGRSVSIAEIIVGIQSAAIPQPRRISVELIGPALGGDIHVGARGATVLTGITVCNHGEFLNFIGSQHVVAGAGVVQVVERVVHVAAVDGVEVRGSRQAVVGKVTVSGARA